MQARPTLASIIIFSLGQFGWSLGIYPVANLLLYFYMPPTDGEQIIFEQFIFQDAVLLGLTIVGLISFEGRILDAVIDPFVASFSDRRKSKFGKRKSLMAISALPFAAFSFLVFYPLSSSGFTLNGLWLSLTIICFYFFYTMYVIPYNALIAELGHHAEDRLKISTAISITFALGLILGSQVYLFQDLLEASFSSIHAFHIVIGVYSLFALLLMLIPVFFLNENKFAKQEVEVVDTLSSLKIVFKDKNFRHFLISDAFYWLALTFIN